MNMGDLKIFKAICEIRYPSSARLFDNRGYFATSWQGKYDLTEWKISQNQVIIHNKSDSTSLQVNYRSSVAVVEMPENFNKFRHLATDFLCDVLDTLQVTQIDRIGLRLILVAEREKFKVLVRKLSQSLYSINDNQWEKLGGVPEDISLPLTLSIGERKANFILGPMDKEELSTHFTSRDVKDILPDVAIFVDFDLFEHNIRLVPKSRKNDIRLFIEDSGKTIEKMSNEFIDEFEGFK